MHNRFQNHPVSLVSSNWESFPIRQAEAKTSKPTLTPAAKADSKVGSGTSRVGNASSVGGNRKKNFVHICEVASTGTSFKHMRSEDCA